MVEVMKIMATSCKSPMHALLHSVSPTLQQATADPCLWPETPGHSRASLGLILVGPLLLSPGCNFMDCIPPGSSVHVILQARILEWGAIPFSRGSHFVRTLHHDPSVLGGPTWHGS